MTDRLLRENIGQRKKKEGKKGKEERIQSYCKPPRESADYGPGDQSSIPPAGGFLMDVTWLRNASVHGRETRICVYERCNYYYYYPGMGYLQKEPKRGERTVDRWKRGQAIGEDDRSLGRTGRPPG